MLIATCIALVILLALAALGIDIGRMYVIKSELQAFADAAALAAALQMDGSDAGFTRARDAAAKLAHGPNAMKWDMGSQSITDIAAAFGKGDSAPDPKSWQEQPRGGDYRFVRVTATASAPLIFLRMFQSAEASKVSAAGVAGRAGGSARLLQ